MNLVEQALSITFVLSLLAVALWFLRRRGMVLFRASGLTSSRRSRLLETVERLPIQPNCTLLLIRAASRGLVVLVHPGGSTLLENAAWEQFECAQAGVPAGKGNTV
jgi:hypothetical protein